MNKETLAIKKVVKRCYKKCKIKIAKMYKKIRKTNENEEQKIHTSNNAETKKDSENIV